MGAAPSRSSSLPSIPTELHLLISTHLDLPSTHALLLTSRHFYHVLLPHLQSFAPAPHGDLTALQWACANSHTPLVRLLLQQGTAGDFDFRIDRKGAAGETALMHAVRAGSVPLIELLLSHGASPNVQNANGDTAVHLAVSQPAPPSRILNLLPLSPAPPPSAVLPALLSGGHGLSIKNKQGNTPLHAAALHVSHRTCSGVAAIRLLLVAGADPKAANGYKYTPLHFAAERGCAEGVMALVEAGADVKAGGQWCLTAKELAGAREWWKVKAYLEGRGG